MFIDVYEEPSYGYDDYRQDMLAEEGARQFDEHEREVEAAGGVCSDPDCYHNLRFANADDDPDADIPF
jgi:hypothetical protein